MASTALCTVTSRGSRWRRGACALARDEHGHGDRYPHPHWHGATLLENGRRLDTTEVFPASSRTLDMTPDRPGMWMLHCHVNDHMEAGMHAMFTVLPNRNSSFASSR